MLNMFIIDSKCLEYQRMLDARPCKHWYPPKTWMTISGHKVCSSCYTDWKLGQMSKTGSIQFRSHPHR